MNEEIKELLEYFMAKGPISPSTLMALANDLRLNRKEVQITIQIGFERGLWHCDPDMKLVPGSLWSKCM